MKTITVKGCNACPFMNHDFGNIKDEQCNAWPEPTQDWDCLYKVVPAECPLRVEGIIVELEKEQEK